LTGPARRSPKIALRRPILSGPPDFGLLVRNSKTLVKGRFPGGRHFPWFEPHLPEIRTSRANTLIRILVGSIAASRVGMPIPAASPHRDNRSAWRKGEVRTVWQARFVQAVAVTHVMEQTMSGLLCLSVFAFAACILRRRTSETTVPGSVCLIEYPHVKSMAATCGPDQARSNPGMRYPREQEGQRAGGSNRRGACAAKHHALAGSPRIACCRVARSGH
jgi:hypothetical protein